MKKDITLILITVAAILALVLPKPVGTVIPLIILIPVVIYLIVDIIKNGNQNLCEGIIMDKLKKNIIFYILLIIDFYVIPWLIKDTGSAMIVMLMIIPLICLVTSIFYGIRNGFNFWYILIVAYSYCITGGFNSITIKKKINFILLN